jgi:hypothetical protein
MSVYSVFGMTTESGESLVGDNGNGFLLSDDLLGYNIQGLNLDNVNDLDVKGCISNTTPGDICVDSNFDMNQNDILDINEIIDGNTSIDVNDGADNLILKTLNTPRVTVSTTSTEIQNTLKVNFIEPRSTPDINIDGILIRDDQVCWGNGFCIDDGLTTANTVTLQFSPNDMLCYDKSTNVMAFSSGGGPLNPDWTISNTVNETRVPIDQTTAAALVIGPTNATSVDITPTLKVDDIQGLSSAGNVDLAGTNGLLIRNSQIQSANIPGNYFDVNDVNGPAVYGGFEVNGTLVADTMTSFGSDLTINTTVLVDEINEDTLDNGVLIESVTIQDGFVGMGHCIPVTYPPRYQFHATTDGSDDSVVFLESACENSNISHSRVVLSQDDQSFAYSIETESDNNLHYRQIRDTAAGGTQKHIFNVGTEWTKLATGYIPVYSDQGTDVLEMGTDTIVKVLTSLESPSLDVDTINPKAASDITLTSGIYINSGTELLDTYDEDIIATTLSGIWAANQSFNPKYLITGSRISMTWDANILATANTATNIVMSANIPLAYRPSTTLYFPIRVIDNGTSKWGLAVVSSSGPLTIYADETQANFLGSGTSGTYATSLSWSV